MPLPLSTTCRPGRESSSGAESTHSRRKSSNILPKATLDDAEDVSIVEPSIARPIVVAPTGTTTLSRNWTAATSTATAETPQNCSCEGPRSAGQCALCVPRSACSWNVHHSVDELKHIGVHEQKLLKLMLHVHRDIHTAASICIPPWPGG